jgi:glycerol-3-phosphate dehydrogenase
VDEVLRGSDAERHDRLIGGTKGSHLVVDWPQGPKHAIFASARSDGRPFFILPWYRYTLVGTTDIRYEGDPSEARCSVDELEYLLDEAARLFPSTPLRRDDVLYTYCGVRPLPRTPAGDESAITRKHFVVDHVKSGGPKGLLSIVGGKLTTFESLARIAIPAIARHTGPSLSPSRAEKRVASEEPLRTDSTLDTPICAHNPETLRDVARAVEDELAMTLADVLLRRLPVGWSACHALDGAQRVVDMVAARSGWTPERAVREVEAYKQELRTTLVPPSDIRE